MCLTENKKAVRKSNRVDSWHLWITLKISIIWDHVIVILQGL